MSHKLVKIKGINRYPEITNKIARVSPTEINGYDFVENDNLYCIF